MCELNDFDGYMKDVFIWAQSSLYCEQIFYKTPDKMFEDFEQKKSPEFMYFSKSDLTETHRFGKELADILDIHVYKNGFKSVSETSTELYYIDVVSKTASNNKRENIDEAKKIKQLIKKLDFDDYVILTPYVNQRKLLQKVCENDNIMTVHKSQGQEWDTVILSVTDRNNMWFTDSTVAQKNGLEVINTALSRARKRIIIVCDYNCWIRKDNQLITDMLRVSKKFNNNKEKCLMIE